MPDPRDAPSPLAHVVRDRLAMLGLSVRAAAILIQVPPSQLASVVNAGVPQNFGRSTRESLTKLGIPRDVIEYTAALTAGYELAPVGMDAHEYVLALRMRHLDYDDIREIRRRVKALTAPKSSDAL